MMTSWFSARGAWRGVKIVLPAALLWLAWAALYVYVQSRTPFPVPRMKLCHVPLYAMGIVKAPLAAGYSPSGLQGAPRKPAPQ